MATIATLGSSPEMRHSFTGRVRNFNLPPTAGNRMTPAFEAVTNAPTRSRNAIPTLGGRRRDHDRGAARPIGRRFRGQCSANLRSELRQMF